MNFAKRFLVEPGSRVKLRDIDPDFVGHHATEESALAEIAKDQARLRELQYLLFADHRHSLLICLQALDAGGKDGTIRHVLGAMNPQGTIVHAFKVPSHYEAAHDFLWRIHQRTPAKGEVAIFNRSQYEDVLVTRVHKLVPKSVWSKRYDQIRAFEKELNQNGTTILKFYLHISEDEQLRRFEKRLDDKNRHWKISESDYSERELWPKYIEAHEDAIEATSTHRAPWYVIPANHKWFRNLAVARIVVETLESLDLKFPPPSVDIEAIRRKYHAATKNQRELARKVARTK
jgi:PPK2 family polyphosphate:nucleotide phosphotransferase